MLKLIKPEIGQLEYRQRLIADSDTMAYNAKWGGTIDFPPEKWGKWHERCLNDAMISSFTAIFTARRRIALWAKLPTVMMKAMANT